MRLLSVIHYSISVSSVMSTACLGADASNNLYLFGTPNGDFSIGPQPWSSASSWQKLSSSNGPDFNVAKGTQCHFSQYNNALVVVNGNSKTSNISTFFFANSTWSQTIVTGDADPKTMNMIYDHDTNVMYGLYKGIMYFIRMDGTPSTTPFVQSNAGPLPESYSESATVGFGQNHIYYLNGPGFQPGQAQIFVIHYAYWQPSLQSYSPVFPQSTGQTVSIPLDSFSVPLVFAYIPDDGSGTYLINVEVGQNTTIKYPAPSVKDPQAQYTATSTSVIQLTSDYQLFTLDISKTWSNWVQVLNPVLDSLKGKSIASGTESIATTTGSSGGSTTGATSNYAGSLPRISIILECFNHINMLLLALYFLREHI